jgi:RHS repeat-associated protein
MREHAIAYLFHSLRPSSRPMCVRRGIGEPKCHKALAVLPLASLLAGMFASTLCGQNVSRETLEARLGDLARKLPSHATSAPPTTAHRLGDGIQQTRATLAELEARLAAGGDTSGVRAAVGDERRKLLALDEAYQVEFARVESTLRGAGLPQPELARRLAAWRGFTANYRSRMDASLAAFDRLGSGSATPSRQAIAALRAGLGEPTAPAKNLPKRPSTPAPLNLPPQPVATVSPAANDTPTPDDLAATNIVQLSPDIRALAASLGNSPAALYAYVYNNIHYVPYILEMQNSEAVLWSGRGNDADQSTLLIALLRAAGVPARYVNATIDIAYADAVNWVGAKDNAGALTILKAAYTGSVDFPSVATDTGTQFQILHTWVEAWVDNGAGGGPVWVDMSPSLKKQTFQPGLEIPIPVFNRAQFLSAPTTRLATDVYGDQIHAALAQNFPGHDFSELGYTGTIVPVADNVLPSFPYTPVTVFVRAAALPQTAEWKETLTLGDANNKVYLTSTFFMPEICLQSVTISYIAATPADQNIIDSFGGIGNVPAGMANLLAQFRLDNVVVATSTLSVPVGGYFGLSQAVTVANSTVAFGTAGYSIILGGPAAVVMVGPQISNAWIGSRIDNLLASLPTASLDTTLRETLFLAGILHDQDMQEAWSGILLPLQYASDYTLRTPFAAFVQGSAAITPLFDRPFLATAGYFSLNDGFDPSHPFNLNAPAGIAADINPLQVIDVTLSQSECRTFDRVALLPSACTISGLQTAAQQKIPVLVLTQANVATLLPTIQRLPSGLYKYFQGIVPYGTITIPNRPVTSGTWTGFPWILDWNDFYTNSFFGLDYANGGSVMDDGTATPVTDNAGVTGNPAPVNGTICSDPVTVSNGNMFQQQTDLAISSRGPGFVLSRTYNSFAAANNGPFGYGWTHSYAMYLRDNGSSLTLVDGSGSVYTFAYQSNGYVAPGLDQVLTRVAQGYNIRSAHGTQWSFNTKGALQSITDRNQNVMQLSYDSSGHLASITDALNRAINFTYDTSNRIVSVQDFTGRQVCYTYDSAGNLATVTDPAGNRTAYTYYTDAVFAHLLQKVTKPAGNWTSFEYYVNRQTARISDSAGRNMRLLYLPFSHQTIFVDARGFASSYYYDQLGEVTRVVKPDDTYIDMSFTSDAKVATTTDEDGNVSQFTYDAMGNMTSAVDPLGETVNLTYEPNFNMLTSVTDALGNVTNFQYDANGNLLQIQRPLSVQFQFAYDSYGELLSVTDAQGNTSTITYDANGDPTMLTDALGNQTQLQFDQLRRMTGLTDPLGNVTSFQRDLLDRLTQVTDPLGNSTSVAFDGNGNLKQTTDANGQNTQYSYDALDQLAKVTDAKSAVTQYGYSTPTCGCNSGSDLQTYQSPSGETRSLSYDFNHRLTQSADASGGSTALVYNSRGDLIRKTDANGNTIQYAYDAVGRLLSKAFPAGSSTNFTYDAVGHQTGASNANTSLAFTYDALNRLSTVSDSRFGTSLAISYNANSQRTALADSAGGNISYSYDQNNRLTSVASATGGNVSITYDALNRPSTVADSNGAGAIYQFDPAGRLTGISFGGSSSAMARRRPSNIHRNVVSASGAPLQFTYAYDNNGNPVSITDATGASSYQFDPLNRLTSASHPASNAESYAYDGAGNRLASATDGNYAYDKLGRLISAEGAEYTYDRNGNILTRTNGNGTTIYTYDFENQLIGIQFPDGTTAAYQYDALGRRIAKNVNGNVTAYFYDGPNILLETDGSGNLQARYTFGPGVDQPLMMERGGQAYFYHADRAGSIAAVTDSMANTVCSYVYDSFGRTQPCQGVTTPFGFAGREYDAESGLYYMRARYYAPATGRFLSSDPLDLTGRLLTGGAWAMGTPQQLNRYSYAVNNPLAFRDPSGLACAALLADLQAAQKNGGNDAVFQYLTKYVDANAQQAFAIRDELRAASATAPGQLSSSTQGGLQSLSIALIGVDRPAATQQAQTPSINTGIFTPQDYQRSNNFVNGVSGYFNGPSVPTGAVPNPR